MFRQLLPRILQTIRKPTGLKCDSKTWLGKSPLVDLIFFILVFSKRYSCTNFHRSLLTLSDIGNILDSLIKSFIVAEKNKFCLSFGIHFSIIAKLSSKSPFNILRIDLEPITSLITQSFIPYLSASSTTKNFILSNENVSHPDK